MAEIFLFGDESGTMPLSKKDGPFVTAFVALLKDNINDLKINYHHGKLLSSLKLNNIEPLINFVYPEDDYEVKFKKKMEKMEVMARYSKLMTNNKHLLLNNDGIPIRNFIWLQGIGLTIGHALLRMLSKEEINKINIFIDQKSMVNTTREFFEINVLDIPQKIINVVQKYSNMFPDYVNNVLSNFKFTSNDISILWNDEDKYTEYKKGLLLSHHLAKYSHKILRKHGIEQLNKIFTEAGFKNSVYNYTKYLIAPLNKNSVEIWKQSTGLPEPEL